MFCEKESDKTYLLYLDNVSQTSSKLFVKTPPFLSLLMSELCFLMCFKLYSLNFAIAHAQKKSVMLIRMGHNCVAKKHKKMTYHLKQAQKFISNLSNLEKKCKLLPFDNNK